MTCMRGQPNGAVIGRDEHGQVPIRKITSAGPSCERMRWATMLFTIGRLAYERFWAFAALDPLMEIRDGSLIATVEWS